MIMRLRTGALINSFHEWKFTANVYLYFMNEILFALLDQSDLGKGAQEEREGDHKDFALKEVEEQDF